MLKRSYIKRKSKTKRVKRMPSNEADYAAWLLTQPCIVTGSEREHHPIDRSHLARYEYGNCAGKKALDWFCIPLHHTLHTELERDKDAWELKWGFQEIWLLKVWQNYGIDRIPLEVQHRFVNPPEV